MTVIVYAFLILWILGLIALNIGEVVDFEKLKKKVK